jgi:hypothetical protein
LLAHRLNPSVNGPPSVLERDLPHWVVKPFGTDFNSILAGMDGLQADLEQATALLKVGKTV